MHRRPFQITDLLFRANGPLGQDLVAKDIQRGRDMGIPSYNHFRALCGLPKAATFDDLRDVMDEEVRLLLGSGRIHAI